MLFRSDRVFVSGDFSVIGGNLQPRRQFAALDTVNGEATEWNPGANSVADAMLLVGDTLYIGGDFTEVGGQPRNYLASIDAASGAMTSWDPNASWPVLAMARSENTIYIGGIFNQVGQQRRGGIAAVDATTGAVTAWSAGTDPNLVEALLVSGNTVYVGGAFGQIGGQPRRSLAALDLVTGTAKAWNPTLTEWDVLNPRVKALVMIDSVLFIGGSFGSVGGQPRICLAAVDTSSGLATDWDPGADGLVWSLAADANTIFVGGGFTRAGGLPAAGLAAFSLPSDPVPESVSFGLAQSVPNPARSNAIIRFTLQQETPVTLSIYDVQGRRTATLLSDAMLEPGIHSVPVLIDGWKPGIYFYRIAAGSKTAVRKMLVMP